MAAENALILFFGLSGDHKGIFAFLYLTRWCILMCVFCRCHTSIKRTGNKNLWTMKEPLWKANKQAHEGTPQSTSVYTVLKTSLTGTQLDICEYAMIASVRLNAFTHVSKPVCLFPQSLLHTARKLFKGGQLYHVIPCLKPINGFPLRRNKIRTSF